MALLTALTGCRYPTPIAANTREAVAAASGPPVPIAQVRSSPDRPLPAQVLDELSPEWSLITITRPADWTLVRRCLDLPPSRHAIDFSRGMIVGLQVSVGERAGGGWPIRLLNINGRAGAGRIEASFVHGLYYPVETAGYVELAYAPGLHQVSMVCIDKRTFLIQSPTPARGSAAPAGPARK